MLTVAFAAFLYKTASKAQYESNSQDTNRYNNSMKKGSNFVPPQVATPQQYFMMNVPLVDSITNQSKPNQTFPNNHAPPSNQAAFNHLLK